MRISKVFMSLFIMLRRLIFSISIRNNIQKKGDSLNRLFNFCLSFLNYVPNSLGYSLKVDFSAT